MIKEERLNGILNIIKEKQFASVEYLSKKLYVSLPTVRRDLAELSRRNLIVRSHGGAMSVPNNKIEIPIDFRSGINTKEKLYIAKKASEQVNDNDMLFIDASTTTLHIIDHITDLKNIKVVTNSIKASLLLNKYNIKSYCTGGRLVENSLAFVGNMAEEAISRFNFDICFFSSYRLNHNGFVTDYSEEETNLRKCALKYSNKIVFLCDKSKFNGSSTYNLISLDETDCIVTDAPLPENLKRFNSKVIIAK